MFGLGFPEVSLLLSVLIYLTLGIYVLRLAARLVKAAERMAAALEKSSSRLPSQ